MPKARVAERSNDKALKTRFCNPLNSLTIEKRQRQRQMNLLNRQFPAMI